MLRLVPRFRRSYPCGSRAYERPALDFKSGPEDTRSSSAGMTTLCTEGALMAEHDHDDHHHQHGSELSETQLRVRALETVLTEKGYIDPAALDAIIEAYETKIGPAQRRACRRQGLERSGVQAGAARRRIQGGEFAGPRKPGRRPSRRGREHPRAAQHDRVHAVLLLSVGSARAAAGLVQVRALPLAGGEGPARRAGRFRRQPAERYRNPRVGFDRRDALPGAADAPARHRRLERGTPRRSW